MADFIPLEECKDRHLYHIKARNFRLGIYDEAQKEFIGIRTKFGSRYLAGEYHWDTGPPHGTVKPIALLEASPFERVTDIPRECSDHDGTFAWLEQKASEYSQEEYPHEAPGHS